MIGRIISALAQQATVRQVGTGSGPASLIIGTAIPLIARRFGPLGLIGLAAGTWAAQRVAARRALRPVPPAARRQLPM